MDEKTFPDEKRWVTITVSIKTLKLLRDTQKLIKEEFGITKKAPSYDKIISTSVRSMYGYAFGKDKN